MSSSQPYDRRHRLLVALVLVLALAVGLAPQRVQRGYAQTTQLPRGLAQLLAAHAPGSAVRGIATFGAVPTAAQVSALQQLGLAVQPMRHLPLAIVYGPIATLRSAVTGGLAHDIYPDLAIELFDTASSDAMGAAATRLAGLTGKGVTVAVVDSGCDASHPDLAKRVVHNVKLYSGEYANINPDGTNTIVVPVEMGPYQNSDIGGGHGTHVAGIIPADGTTGANHLGVAPDAELVCYSIGEVLFTTAVVTAYDHMLDQPGLWSIDVVNNSWGNSFRQFDPRDPVAVATRAVASHKVTVVFAAGNSGDGNAQMSLNPFSQSPWVLSVASGTLDHKRSGFSSNGLVFDNAQATTIGAGGHTVFMGDRIGLYHPDVTAPGSSISSTCATSGVAIGPCPPPNYDNATASGTSMAAPHVAGAAAVLLQVNPSLTPAQVRMALQSTATSVAAGDGSAAPFWQVGYGYVNLPAAVKLVRSASWANKLASAQAAADQRVLAADNMRIARSDFWTYDAPPVALAGSDTRSFKVVVPSGVTHLKISLSHPSLAVLGANEMSYTVTVYDAAGRKLGTTTEATTGAGTATLQLRLGALTPPVTYGKFTFAVRGELAASDPNTIDSESLLGRMVTLHVAQLVRG